jgi:hypothetical protein
MQSFDNSKAQPWANMPSGFAVYFRPPPAHTHEEKAPVVKELRRFVLESVTDKLEDPSECKQGGGIEPHSMQENADEKKCERKKNDGDAQGVADAIDGVLMAGGILRDPLLAAAVA